MFVSECLHLLSQRTQLTEHYTSSCHLLHVSAIFRWIVLALTINTAQYSTVQYSTAQHSTAQHSTAQHSTVQYSTAQRRDCYFQVL